jgi:hypothetical protein
MAPERVPRAGSWRNVITRNIRADLREEGYGFLGLAHHRSQRGAILVVPLALQLHAILAFAKVIGLASPPVLVRRETRAVDPLKGALRAGVGQTEPDAILQNAGITGEHIVVLVQPANRDGVCAVTSVVHVATPSY